METPDAPLRVSDDVTGAVAALDDLAQRPLHEHVQRLEAAHAVLRRALDAPAL